MTKLDRARATMRRRRDDVAICRTLMATTRGSGLVAVRLAKAQAAYETALARYQRIFQEQAR